jgi:Flp pilus assembly protein TadB
VINRQHNGQKKENRQHNGQKKKNRQRNGQKKKNRQHNGQRKKIRQRNGVCSLFYNHCVVCPSDCRVFFILWSLCCLSFWLSCVLYSMTIVLSVLLIVVCSLFYDHCVVCPNTMVIE